MMSSVAVTNCQTSQEGLAAIIPTCYKTPYALKVHELKYYLLEGTDGKKKENQGEDKTVRSLSKMTYKKENHLRGSEKAKIKIGEQKLLKNS